MVFGLITVAGAKIWVDNKIDFTQNSTLIIAAVSLIMGAGNFSLHIGAFDLGGIGTATLAAIMLNLFLNRGEDVANCQNSEIDEQAMSAKNHIDTQSVTRPVVPH